MPPTEEWDITVSGSWSSNVLRSAEEKTLREEKIPEEKNTEGKDSKTL